MDTPQFPEGPVLPQEEGKIIMVVSGQGVIKCDDPRVKIEKRGG